MEVAAGVAVGVAADVPVLAQEVLEVQEVLGSPEAEQ